jgi:hypothetical protein
VPKKESAVKWYADCRIDCWMMAGGQDEEEDLPYGSPSAAERTEAAG